MNQSSRLAPLAAALLGLSVADRTQLAAMLFGQQVQGNPEWKAP
jgi:hypothetical protein